jgi:hypothetical protein
MRIEGVIFGASDLLHSISCFIGVLGIMDIYTMKNDHARVDFHGKGFRVGSFLLLVLLRLFSYNCMILNILAVFKLNNTRFLSINLKTY